MNKSPIIFSLVCLSLLTACGSSTTSSWITPEPGLRDEAVAALLPHDVYTVSCEWLKDEKPITTIEGHGSFGGGVDGSQCAAEYALTNVYPSDALGLKALDWVHVVTAPGGPTWQRGYFDPTGPGEWTDSSYPSAAEISFVFIPVIIGADWNPGVLEGAGDRREGARWRGRAAVAEEDAEPGLFFRFRFRLGACCSGAAGCAR